jgi:hypothetical protein
MTGIDWPPLPDMGVYLTWPEKGLDAIHPNDRVLAEQLIPSDRVFLRTAFDGAYYTVEYGKQSIRIQPSLWLQVKDEGFRIGDQVEVPSRMMQNDPMIAVILEMRYSQENGIIHYLLLHNEMPVEHPFTAEDLIQLKPHVKLQPRDYQPPTPKYTPPSDPDPSLSIDEEGTKS